MAKVGGASALDPLSSYLPASAVMAQRSASHSTTGHSSKQDPAAGANYKKGAQANQRAELAHVNIANRARENHGRPRIRIFQYCSRS
jgi:hypothetical protein